MITIADYIHELREVQSNLEIVRGDLDKAIDFIENDSETESRLSALASLCLLKDVENDLKKILKTKIF